MYIGTDMNKKDIKNIFVYEKVILIISLFSPVLKSVCILCSFSTHAQTNAENLSRLGL